MQSTTLTLALSRDRLVEDTFDQLAVRKPHELRRQLRVKFQGEEGLDEGGLRKEFFQLLMSKLFDASYGMFSYNQESRLCWFEPVKPADRLEEGLFSDYFTVGQLFGLAMYNSLNLDARFPLALYKLIAHRPVELEDLLQLNPSLGRTLQSILGMDEEEFGATIQCFDGHIDVPCEGGSFQHPLSASSWCHGQRHGFVHEYTQAILVETLQPALQNFIDGFRSVSESSFLYRFHPQEIERLICGSTDYDFVALERATAYDGGFSRESEVIRWFWELVHEEMSVEQRRRLLRFVTGSDRAPVGGLGKLAFKIVRNGPDASRLPTAHTCFNVLLLNEYSSKERLRAWVYRAIDNYAGFGLQ